MFVVTSFELLVSLQANVETEENKKNLGSDNWSQGLNHDVGELFIVYSLCFMEDLTVIIQFLKNTAPKLIKFNFVMKAKKKPSFCSYLLLSY